MRVTLLFWSTHKSGLPKPASRSLQERTLAGSDTAIRGKSPAWATDSGCRFFGRVESRLDGEGRLVKEWVDTRDVLATPYDTPVPGYGTRTVNTLRLWTARAVHEFDLQEFNEGDYVAAIQDRVE